MQNTKGCNNIHRKYAFSLSRLKRLRNCLIQEQLDWILLSILWIQRTKLSIEHERPTRNPFPIEWKIQTYVLLDSPQIAQFSRHLPTVFLPKY